MNDVSRQAVDVDVSVLALSSRITINQLEPQRYGDIALFTPEIANNIDLDMEVINNSAEYAEVETTKVSSLIQ